MNICLRLREGEQHVQERATRVVELDSIPRPCSLHCFSWAWSNLAFSFFLSRLPPCLPLGNWVCGAGRHGNRTFLVWNNIWPQFFRQERKDLSCGRLLTPKITTAMVINIYQPDSVPGVVLVTLYYLI